MSQQNIRILFGAFSPRIEEQLQDQGFKLDMEPLQMVLLQRNVDAVTDLRIHCILTEAEADKARKRILQIIKKHLKLA